ncbi:MAG: hypothetical protein RML45_00870 [Acetobacteraceae bacterium]|nr:hypothetical protein [Acetobacteraceae bacterium]
MAVPSEWFCQTRAAGDVAEFLFLGGAVPPTTWNTIIANMNAFYGVT